jgi:hypothetical protein
LIVGMSRRVSLWVLALGMLALGMGMRMGRRSRKALVRMHHPLWWVWRIRAMLGLGMVSLGIRMLLGIMSRGMLGMGVRESTSHVRRRRREHRVRRLCGTVGIVTLRVVTRVIPALLMGRKMTRRVRGRT